MIQHEERQGLSGENKTGEGGKRDRGALGRVRASAESA